MTKEIQEGNSLIAVFDGWTHSPFPNTPNKMYKGATGIHINQLEYHCTWGALMPVVEKMAQFQYTEEGDDIQDTAYPRTFGAISESGNFMVRINRCSLFEDKELIIAAWQAVIEFIKWYNEKQESK